MLQRIKRLIAFFIAAVTASALLGSATLTGGVALADSSLRRGDKGPAVEELQKLLKEHGCYDFDEITGYFGATTEAGVRKFQTLNGLKADGVAGDDTMKLLRQKKIKLKDPDSLCLGMSGPKVEEIQKRLKELGLYNEPEITGYFGPATEQAVKAFQEASGMTADGIVGKKTKAAMFSSFKSTTMVPGMKGDNVTSLQKQLAKLGYYDGPITGLYGQLTQKAVKYFQQLNGLQQDGVCGKATYNAVFAKNAKSEKEARRSPPKTTPRPTPTYQDVPGQSAHGQEMSAQVVEFAKLQLGKKYVYATEGPDTFDCSGLTYYVYKHFGVTLPRSSSAQGGTNYGIKITAKSKLLPGDLLFFGDSGGIHHAGLYVGDGKFIHAPYTGTVVQYGNIANARDFFWGRRVFR